MTRAYQGYYSDYVQDTAGNAIVGATVNLYLAAGFTVPPFPTGSTAVAVTATTTTDANGFYAFDKLIPDDYYIQVVYTPAGGATTYTWKYQVPIFDYEETRRTRERGLAAGVARTVSKLHAGLNVLICCVGDSITVGYDSSGVVTTGYVADLAAGLAALYPNATVKRADPQNYGTTSDAAIGAWTYITVQTGAGASPQVISVINCGVTGDTALRVMRRFTNINANGQPDLVTLYLGTNEMVNTDTTKYVDAPTFQAHLAALVNQIQTQMACEVMLLALPLQQPSFGSVAPYAEATRAVALLTRCALVDVYKLWADHYDPAGTNYGYGTWLSGITGSYTQPSDVGHQIIANEILRLFQVANEAPLPQTGAPSAFAAGKSPELVRYPQQSAGVLATAMVLGGGGWATSTGFQNAAQCAGSNAAGAGIENQTSTAGNTVTWQGRCTEIYMLCRKWHDSGIVTVTVDGVGLAQQIDMYRAGPTSTTDLADSNGAIAPQDRVLVASGLTDAVHTVVLTLSASKNAASSGTLWRFDALEVVRQRRQGWEVEGAEPALRLLRGTVAVSLAAASSGNTTVTFATAFNSQNGLPTVVATSNNINYFAVVGTVTLTTAQIYLVRRDGTNVTDTQNVTWVAVGP